MGLSKYKWEKSSAERIFTNREKQINYFLKSLSEYIENDRLLKLIAYYGHGGIGKSSLAKEIYYKKIESTEQTDFVKVFIDLGLKGLDDPIESLWIIRKQLNFKCILFDCALSYYWSLTNPSKLDITHKNIFNQNYYTEIIDDTLNNFIGISPLKGMHNILNIAKDIYFKNRPYVKNIIDELESFLDKPKEIFLRLPYYLGMDIEHHLKNKTYQRRIVVFFDAYEQFYEDGANTKSRWIREFIGSIGAGLFVITGRDKLSWEKITPEWKEYFVYELLEKLSDRDARKFLSSIPIKDDKVIRQMIASSGGIPFNLDRLVDIYERKIKTEQKFDQKDFKIPSAQIISVFLDHLEETEKYLVFSLAVIGVFNKPLVAHIAHNTNMDFSSLKINSFLERTFIEKINNEINIYRLHQILRENVIGVVDSSSKELILKLSTRYISTTGLLTLTQNEIFHFFISLIDSIKLIKFFDEVIIEAILDIGLYLYDKGWWYELERNIKEITTDDDAINTALTFINALSTRKVMSISLGIKLLNEIKDNVGLLGKHTLSYCSELAYLNSIIGNYEFAIKEFERLYHIVDQKQNQERYFARIVEYYSDILSLTGNFNQALITALEAENQLDETQKDNHAINFRVIGHIYRFNMQLDKAEFYYLKAFSCFSKNDYLEGRIYTNFAETLCYSNPYEALEWAKKSIKKNKYLHSSIEIGKAFTASSIAETVLGNYKLAQNHIDDAEKHYKKIGYKAGLLFNKIAMFYLGIATRVNSNRLFKISKLIQKDLNDIQVYQYLQLPIHIFYKNEQAIENFNQKFEWVDFDTTKQQIIQFLNKITK